jgi:predicted SnoaL-like aldol condensation-catalyzing enzyme
MKRLIISTVFAAAASLAAAMAAAPAVAQEAVVGAPDEDALYKDADPRLNAMKQVAYHIEKELLQAGHWEMANQFLTDRYIQHNPNAKSGLPGVIYFFTQVLKVQPKPIPDKVHVNTVAVIAEGDLVTVMTAKAVNNAQDPSKSYTTTWFDTWRIKDGKADEHWDPATKN